MLSRLSIRARITLGSALVAAILLAAGLFALSSLVATIVAGADLSLTTDDLTAFEKDIIAHPAEPIDNPGTGVLVYIRNPAGAVQVDTLPLAVKILVDHRVATNETFLTTDGAGRNFVVVGRVVSTPSGAWSLWSTRSTSSSELALKGLNSVLIIGGASLALAFGVAAWVLASIALRPVARMRRRAELLGAEPGDGDLPVGTAKDELAALAVTLNAFLARVRESTAREKRMVSDAAHELRTPLAALRTQLELAHDDFGNADALAEQVLAAEASVGRLSSLATNLLELSRLDSPERPPASTGTAELVTEFMGSIDRARMLALPKSADIGFALPIDEPPGRDETSTYALDAQSFGRLVDNLLANAIDAIPAGGSVLATLRQYGSEIVLEILDDGPGMPEAFIAHAFDRFTRPDASRTGGSGGSGLGLALVLAIAQAAGGNATLRNTHPGFTATVTIPKM